MSKLTNEIEARLDEIRREIPILERSLRNVPDGRLRISMNGNNPRYYHMTKSGDVSGKYIRRADQGLAERLAQKDYDGKVLKLLKKEEQLLCRIVHYYDEVAGEGSKSKARPGESQFDFFSGPEELILEKSVDARKKLIMPLVPDTQTFVKEWLSERYEKKSIQDNLTEYITGSGIRVRSKTELIIAEILEKRGIPFYYEKPLVLRGAGTVHPDFTVLNIRQRKTYYWEHMGMMDDEAYRDYALEKINHYMLSGHFPGVDLILTHESSQRPIRTQILEKTIETYLES